ncbi:MAG: M20 family metallo-hydrolase [Gammaproteobacteria bacterium]|nr:M20 family metallo-hydrolase [Gammaproteobacteria bacterium]
MLRPDAKAAAVGNAVDQDRLWDLLMRLAEIGALENGGVNRQALTELDTEAKNFVIEWARTRGFSAFQDDAANLFVRMPGAAASQDPLIVGSHLDSQPTGGKFDGAFGVLAGLEVLESIRQQGLTPERPIEVAAWTNEEASRFLPGATGSSAFAGTRELSAVLDNRTVDGARVGDELAASIAATRAELRPIHSVRPCASLEIHIEQGPILEQAGLPVGIVKGIQGVRRIQVEILGETAHAGTTPQALRKDALDGAARIMVSLRSLTKDDDDILRLTFGRIDSFPNSPGTVTDKVRLTIDLRHPDKAVMDKVEGLIREVATAQAHPCRTEVRVLSTVDPIAFDPSIIGLLENCANMMNASGPLMLSGAGHDSLHLGRICPTGMVFVACEGGISHHEAENAKPFDLALGTRVLAAAAWTLANR